MNQANAVHTIKQYDHYYCSMLCHVLTRLSDCKHDAMNSQAKSRLVAGKFCSVIEAHTTAAPSRLARFWARTCRRNILSGQQIHTCSMPSRPHCLAGLRHPNHLRQAVIGMIQYLCSGGSSHSSARQMQWLFMLLGQAHGTALHPCTQFANRLL